MAECVDAREAAEIAAIKARYVEAQQKAKPESLGRCKLNGEPLTARHGVMPREGTVMVADNAADLTGVCPLCGTRAKVSGSSGAMCAHVMRGETLPASPALSEPNVQPVDTGSRSGDPESAGKRRAQDVADANGRGVVSVVQVVDGKKTRVDVEATDTNLRLAISQENGRNLRSADSIAARDALVKELWRRVRALKDGSLDMVLTDGPLDKDASRVKAAIGQRDHGSLDGVAMTHGVDKGTRTREQWLAGQKSGPQRTTLDDPKGRERVDPVALGVTVHDREIPVCDAGQCDHIVGNVDDRLAWAMTWVQFSAAGTARQRRYWTYVKRERARAKRERAAGRPGVPGSGTGAMGTRSLVDGSESGKVERIMRQRPDGRRSTDWDALKSR